MDTLDPQLVNFAKAIRQQESGGDFTRQGSSREYGAYQWIPETWNAKSKEFGINTPLQQATPEQQNEVAYKTLAQWKQQHPDWNVGNFASAWNAGEGEPNAYQGTFSNGKPSIGKNSFGVHYDVPSYAKAVAQNYQQYKNESPQLPDEEAPNTIPTTSPSQPGLIPQLIGRFETGAKGLGETTSAVGDLFTPQHDTGKDLLNIGQGALHVFGSAAGALGDATNAVLDKIPGVKPLENLIGMGVGKLAQTPVGQSILNQYLSFQQKNPELAQDAGDVFNIATAIPILKGIGVAGDIALDTVSMALKKPAESIFANSMEDIINGQRGKAARIFLSENPDIGKLMAKESVIPDIQSANGRSFFDTTETSKELWQKTMDLNEQVSNHLTNPKYSTVAEDSKPIINDVLNGYVDRNGNKIKALSSSELTSQEIVNIGRELTPLQGKLWSKFEANQANMQEINTLRSELDQATKSVYASTNQPPFKKEVASELAGAMRNFVQSNVPETQDLFKQMTNHFKIQDALNYINGKTVPMGAVGKGLKYATTIGGEKLGQKVLGTPIMGAVLGYGEGSALGRGLGGLSEAALKRVAPGATRQSLKSLGWLSGAPIQRKVNPNPILSNMNQ